MNFEEIKLRLNNTNIDNYFQISNDVASQLIHFIDVTEESETIYFDLLNFTGLDIPSACKTLILTTAFNNSSKLRKICFDRALIEVHESLKIAFNIDDENFSIKLRNALLGNEFVQNGYDNSSWNEAINLLDELNNQKINASGNINNTIFWSKVDDHDYLNNNFITIENSTIGPRMYFLDLVYNNWSSDGIPSPKLEELWKMLSVMFAKNTINAMKKQNISHVNYYYQAGTSSFGDIFLEVELPMLLLNNITEFIVHIIDENNTELDVININLADIYKLGDIKYLSAEILNNYFLEQIKKSKEVIK